MNIIIKDGQIEREEQKEERKKEKEDRKEDTDKWKDGRGIGLRKKGRGE